MSRKFEVRSFHWLEGELRALHHAFNSLEEALHFSRRSTAHTTKVYDQSGELICTVSQAPADTYA